MSKQVHIMFDDPAEAEYQAQKALGVSLHVLLRTMLRMWQAGEIKVERADIQRHQGHKVHLGDTP